MFTVGFTRRFPRSSLGRDTELEAEEGRGLLDGGPLPGLMAGAQDTARFNPAL